MLALIWLAGRVESSAGGRFPALAAAVDLAFLPALAIDITPALQAAPRRNRIFLPVLGVLAGFTRAGGAVALAAALLNAWRLHGWQGSRTLQEPIIRVLHSGVCG